MQYLMEQILPIIVVFGVALSFVYAHHWWASRRDARKWKKISESYCWRLKSMDETQR